MTSKKMYYIKTEIVNAFPSTANQYRMAKGKPYDNSYNTEGYEIRSLEGGASYDWECENSFNQKYRDLTECMTFSDALYVMNEGLNVARSGWNKEKFLFIKGKTVTPVDYFVRTRGIKAVSIESIIDCDKDDIEIKPCVCMSDREGHVTYGWCPSQEDMFANDWVTLSD